MDIKNLFKRKKSKIYSKNEKNLASDRKVWRTIVLVFVIINICTISFSWYLFLQINGGDIFNIKRDNVVSIETISRKLLSDTTASFEGRADGFDKLKRVGSSGIVDPSL
jgi:hypothetical protein